MHTSVQVVRLFCVLCHADEVETVRAAAGALANLSAYDELCEQIVDGGGKKALINALSCGAELAQWPAIVAVNNIAERT